MEIQGLRMDSIQVDWAQDLPPFQCGVGWRREGGGRRGSRRLTEPPFISPLPVQCDVAGIWVTPSVLHLSPTISASVQSIQPWSVCSEKLVRHSGRRDAICFPARACLHSEWIRAVIKCITETA